MIARNDIMAQYRLHLMSRHGPMSTLPVTRHIQSPASITHIVVKLFLPFLSHHKWRHLIQLTVQLPQFHILLLLLITLRVAPLQPYCLFFFRPRADVVYLPRQRLLTASADYWHLLMVLHLYPSLLNEQLSFSFLTAWLSLWWCFSQSPSAIYSSPKSNSPATLRTSLNNSFHIHVPSSTNISTTSRSLRINTKQQR